MHVYLKEESERKRGYRGEIEKDPFLTTIKNQRHIPKNTKELKKNNPKPFILIKKGKGGKTHTTSNNPIGV